MGEPGGCYGQPPLLVQKYGPKIRAPARLFEGVIVNEICTVGLHDSLYAVVEPVRSGGGGGEKI